MSLEYKRLQLTLQKAMMIDQALKHTGPVRLDGYERLAALVKLCSRNRAAELPHGLNDSACSVRCAGTPSHGYKLS